MLYSVVFKDVSGTSGELMLQRVWSPPPCRQCLLSMTFCDMIINLPEAHVAGTATGAAVGTVVGSVVPLVVGSVVAAVVPIVVGSVTSAQGCVTCTMYNHTLD